MKNLKIPLPIDAYLDEIQAKVIESSTVLIKASPGSGKTTRLPWFIAKNATQKVIVLEPRRLAAKLAAERIAFEEGFICGEEVGYHFRFDRRMKDSTQLIFYTEGTFLRRALSDPDLSTVGTIILDEFHERHLETDMALAYLLELKKRRPEIKLILMSATLDTELTKLLSDAAIINIEAPNYPVALHYLPNTPSILNQSLEQKIRGALEQMKPTGDILVFLPGMREILKVQEYLGERFGEVHILHSEVSKEEQELSLKPASKRKIILSTNIAESSVTIPGIVYVIDAGIQREAHYSPWNGLKLILDKPVTKSSAIQRAGRAGRTAPGECFRLYSLQDFEARENFTLPEILRADLTDTYLLSRQLPHNLSWMTPPPEERWQKARTLCYLMGYINQEDKTTSLSSHSYPVDLRLSRVLIAGETLNKENKKSLLNYICYTLEDDRSGVLFRRLASYLDKPGTKDFWEKALLAGFIDQVARYRPKQNDFIHYSGKTIKLHPSLGTLTEGYYLVLDITQRQEAIKIISIEEEWLFEHDPFPFNEESLISVEPKFTLRSQTKLGSIVIDENQLPLHWSSLNSDQQQKVLELGEKVFQKKLKDWQETENYNRYHYWRKLHPGEEEAICLKNYFDFSQELSWDQLDEYFKQSFSDPAMERELPWQIELGGRRELKIHYPFNLDPFVEAPIQEFYGTKVTPTIGQNRMPLTLKLLGPHKRPLQVTKDLPGFWNKTYHEMKKELMREYPRHHWSEDPANAKPLLLKRHLSES